MNFTIPAGSLAVGDVIHFDGEIDSGGGSDRIVARLMHGDRVLSEWRNHPVGTFDRGTPWPITRLRLRRRKPFSALFSGVARDGFGEVILSRTIALSTAAPSRPA